MPVQPYCAPAWLPGGHAQTLFPLLIKPQSPAYRRERWETPDGDFIDLDWLDTSPEAASGAPLVVLFHGLEGDSSSHYATALMHALTARGWAGVVPHFRGCSGELNRLPRGYHSGDSEEIDWIVRRLRKDYPGNVLYVAGVSLGGNALLKWLGERGQSAQDIVTAAASVCAPLDLTICGHHLARGFNRLYTANFLHTLKRKAITRLAQHPGLFDGDQVARARNLYEFDNLVTAPLHGFRDADDYWQRASAKPLLTGIQVPTLLLQTLNDPFLPVHALPLRKELSAQVLADFPATGGHVGFVSGAMPGHLDWLPQRLLGFFEQYGR